MLLVAGIVLLILGWPCYTYLAFKFGIRSKHGDYIDVDLKDLGYFEIDASTATIESIPERHRNLDGKKVFLQGDIQRPEMDYSKLLSFQLVAPGRRHPNLPDRVFSTVNKGAAIKYDFTGTYNVYGTLHFTMKRDPASNEVIEVYHLDVDKVEPKN